MHITPLEWALTIGFVLALILFDLIKHRKPKEVSLKEAAWETLAWTVLGVAFVGVIYAANGSQAAGEYFAGYLLERTLSVDNVFVFVLILSFFAVPPVLQHRALLFGVMAALVMRAIFIVVGAGLLDAFHWMLFVFGAFLIFTAFRLATSGDEEVDPEKNVALRGLRKVMPVTNEYHDNKLLTRLPTGKKAATPLLAVLLVIGTTDLIFAIDSIPAIFSVTKETYLVFTANAFALLGLRPMTFLLANVMQRFAYLKHALAIVLALVGLKMVAEGFHWPKDGIPVWLTLPIIVIVLAGGIGFSWYKTRGVEPEEVLK